MEAAAEVTATTEASVESSGWPPPPPLLLLLLPFPWWLFALVAAAGAADVSRNEVGLFSLLFLSTRLSVELMTRDAADDGLGATEDDDLVNGFLSPTDDLRKESKTALGSIL
jgi:hypothetical protein